MESAIVKVLILVITILVVLQVTLVSNLEQFGFSLSALSHVCQLGVAASCGVTRSPGARADQLMLQGDQVGTPHCSIYSIHIIINTTRKTAHIPIQHIKNSVVKKNGKNLLVS